MKYVFDLERINVGSLPVFRLNASINLFVLASSSSLEFFLLVLGKTVGF